MKKALAWILLAVLLCSSTGALADINDITRFQPYTKVDLSVFINKGYDCYYDDFEFMAEIDPAGGDIVYSARDDEYTISMDIKILYNAGTCTLIPRMIFKRSGQKTYFDDRMSKVYIKNGNNRYIIDVANCSRSTNSKSYIGTDSSVEPIYSAGIIMLQDLATAPKNVVVKMGSYTDVFTLKAVDLLLIKSFFEDCKAAGIFEQPNMGQADDYLIKTMHNENAPVNKESPDATPVPPAQ